MSNLKNKRLSEANRETILLFASKQIKETEDRSALDAAYELAADAIYAKILSDNPPSDMAVLQKYNLAHKDQCIYVSTGGYNYERFDYRDGDHRIIMRARQENCQRQAIKLDAGAEAATDAYRAAMKSVEKDRAVRLNDFRALVKGMTTFNDLVEAWPAVEVMRTAIVGSSSALTVLSSETIDRIKADPAFAAVNA